MVRRRREVGLRMGGGEGVGVRDFKKTKQGEQIINYNPQQQLNFQQH